MLRKKGEQGSIGLRARKVEKLRKKSVLSIPIPAGLNANDKDEGFLFQGNSRPS